MSWHQWFQFWPTALGPGGSRPNLRSHGALLDKIILKSIGTHKIDASSLNKQRWMKPFFYISMITARTSPGAPLARDTRTTMSALTLTRDGGEGESQTMSSLTEAQIMTTARG